MNAYEIFLKNKQIVSESFGIEVQRDSLNEKLFDFQRDIVTWALRKGRAAIFADCGMGKTAMQLEFAKHVPGKILILAPLAVARQTVREGEKFGIECVYAREQIDAKITVANYEMLHRFNSQEYAGIILDESSILKSFDGKFRNKIISSFDRTPFRLACTATPAPNDYMELGSHSEFLGALTRTEMLSTFFVHDGGDTSKWRLKKHARRDFWKWICSWAVMLRKPSDLGYSDEGFILPKLSFHDETIEASKPTEGMLFAMPASTLAERRTARRESIEERAAEVARLVALKSKEPWLIWCNLNKEAEAIMEKIPSAVEIRGPDKSEDKESKMTLFANGLLRVLVTKPSIAGHGMNWQHCANIVFMGLSDSYEDFYQAVRRCWRFGQKNDVDCYIVTSSNEGAVVENIRRKEKEAMQMAEGMVSNMQELNKKEIHGEATSARAEYKTRIEKGDAWEVRLGDSVELIREIGAESVHYSIFSPPFASLYTYSASERDMGNCKTREEFLHHFNFLLLELYRVIMPGRLLSFHCMNLPSSKQHDGVIGIHDFRGELIRSFQNAGFIYHSEVVIWKDPVTAMQRTKALGLLHKQLKKDSCMSRQGIPDYLVTMRKRGDNPERVTHTDESFPVSVWQRYASPIWMDIEANDTLQKESAREHEDEKHICPLQLQVIRRALELWTNPNDLVLSPFAGIGSEGYVAIELGRRFLGMELKESYYNQAVANLRMAKPLDLFSMGPEERIPGERYAHKHVKASI